MLVLSIGLPGMFVGWGERLVASLVGHGGASVDMLVANGLAEIAEAMILTQAEHLVVGVREPDARLRAALVGSGKPLLVFLDDPQRGALHEIADLGHSVTDAVRNLSGSCVKLMDFGQLAHGLVLHPRRDGADLVGTARRIAAFLGIDVPEDMLTTIVAQVTPQEVLDYLAPLTGAARPGDRLQAAFERLTERERAMLDETLGTYAGAFEGRGFGRMVWPRDLFGISDSPSEAAMRDIDIAGKARCLIFGPYMQLFAGNWTARVVLGFSPETLTTDFTIDVATSERLAHTAFRPDSAGVYEIVLDFAIENPDRAVEIRVWSERAAFDGHIALGFVALTPGQVPVPRAESVEAYLAGRLSA